MSVTSPNNNIIESLIMWEIKCKKSGMKAKMKEGRSDHFPWSTHRREIQASAEDGPLAEFESMPLFMSIRSHKTISQFHTYQLHKSKHGKTKNIC